MAEKTLPKPLSGVEIQEAVIAKLRQSMGVDCRLQPHMAFGAFRMKIRIELQLQDPSGGTDAKTNHEVVVEQGAEDLEGVEQLLVEAEQEMMPPNRVRMAAALPIPTLVTGADGHTEEKAVSYRDPEFVAKATPQPIRVKNKGRGR